MLKVENLEKHYPNFTLQCTMEIPDGYITGLIGRNGTGKTTLFKSILGLVSPDSGHIELFGKDAARLSVRDRERLGVTFSDAWFSSWMKLGDITAMLGALYRDFDSASFLRECARFGIPSDQKLSSFSSGTRAKLHLLAALSHRASFLILDEPTAGLDVVARDELLDILRDYIAEDEARAILISSHISSDLEGLCDDLYMIDEGKIIYHETVDTLLGEYAVLKCTDAQYQTLDKAYLIKEHKEPYGYRCLTNQKQYYLDNFPEIVAERSSIDDIITLMAS